MKNAVRMTLRSLLALIAVLAFVTASALAAPISVFDGWQQIQMASNEDGTVGPGAGGQAFDAEYLFVKQNGSNISLGLQTGFDIVDGQQTYTDSRTYFTGDLALSFDNDISDYEFAYDFGFNTYGYAHTPTGIGTDFGMHNEGLYSVSEWNDQSAIYFSNSNPFAMVQGSLIAGLKSEFGAEGYGTDNSITSYFRIIEFNLLDLGLAEIPTVMDVHWTMSCGNDEIDGEYNIAPVPEPSTVLLLGGGLLGLAWYGRKRKKE